MNQRHLHAAEAGTVTLTTALTSLDLSAAAGTAAPKFTIVAYNGGVIRPNTNPPMAYPIVVDLAGMERPTKSVPILKDHDARQHVGHTDTVDITATDIRMTGVISGASLAAAEVVAASRNGFTWPVSIGSTMEKVELIAAGKSVTVNARTVPGPVYVVRKSRLKETSLLTIAADDSAFAKIAASAAESSTSMNFAQYLAANGFGLESTLTAEQATALKAAWQATTDAPADPVANAREAERTRMTALATLCAGHPAVITKAVTHDWTLDEVRAEIKAADLQERLSAPHINASGYGTGRAGNRGTTPAAINPTAILTAGFMIHAGMEAAAVKAYGEGATQMAADLRCNSILDLCASALRLENTDVPRGTEPMIRAAFSTMSLPVALSNLAEKQSADAFTNTPSVWGSIARRRPVNNFKPGTIVRVVLLGTLEQLPPGGEIKHATFGESSLTVQAFTKAKMLGLDRTDIINDDLSVFNDTAQALGRMTARSLNDDFVKSFMNNNSFFSTGHGNLITGTDLDVAGLTAAVTSASKRVGPDGTPIDVRPKILLVPPELEFAARQLIASETVSRTTITKTTGTSTTTTTPSTDNMGTANPLQDVLDVLVEPRLSNAQYAGNGLGYYLFSAPADGAVNVAFLNGRDQPTIESDETKFNTLGIQYRAYIDYGFSAGEPLAATKVTP